MPRLWQWTASCYLPDGIKGTAKLKHPVKVSIIISGSQNKPGRLSTLVSRNIIISGHRTSVRLEPDMWDGLREICRRERSSLHQICTSISLQKPYESSLTASIRVFIMRYYRGAATEEGHRKYGHGLGITRDMDGMSSFTTYNNRSAAVLTKTSFA